MEEDNQRKQRLMEIFDKAHAMENLDEIDENALEQICEIMGESNEIMRSSSLGTTTTSELLLDANILKMNCEQFSRALTRQSKFNEDVFAQAIREMEWEEIAEIVCPVIRSINSNHIAYPVLVDEQLTVKEKTQRKKKTVPDHLTQPENVDKNKRVDKGVKAIILFQNAVVEIFKSNGNEPVPYYKLIINPSNFMKSVENAFYLSFLVRDSIIFMDITDKKHPLVRLVKDEERNAPNKQFIVTMSEDLFDQMIKYYNITKPMLNIELENEDSDDNDNDDDDDDDDNDNAN